MTIGSVPGATTTFVPPIAMPLAPTELNYHTAHDIHYNYPHNTNVCEIAESLSKLVGRSRRKHNMHHESFCYFLEQSIVKKKKTSRNFSSYTAAVIYPVKVIFRKSIHCNLNLCLEEKIFAFCFFFSEKIHSGSIATAPVAMPKSVTCIIIMTDYPALL